MSRIYRLAGAMIAQTKDRYFLIGDKKEPVDFAVHGFTAPAERDVVQINFVELNCIGPVSLESPFLQMDLEGEALTEKLSQNFLIRRNGSVSERLWHLAIEYSRPLPDQESGLGLDAQWLALMPEEIWDIVRDSVLRC